MAEEAEKHIVNLDVAKTGRSTCRATGDKIEKGEHRVGVEAYTGGHISMTWQVLCWGKSRVVTHPPVVMTLYPDLLRISAHVSLLDKIHFVIHAV